MSPRFIFAALVSAAFCIAMIFAGLTTLKHVGQRVDSAKMRSGYVRDRPEVVISRFPNNWNWFVARMYPDDIPLLLPLPFRLRLVSPRPFCRR
jgi:hypothetical protein